MAATWQYHRHVNRSAEDARVRSNAQAAIVLIDTLLKPGNPFPINDGWRRANVMGEFVLTGELVRRKPSTVVPAFWS